MNTTSKNKITILGGKGMLGTDLAEVCLSSGFDITSLDLPEFDITNTEQLATAVESADTIINCAAYTNVDRAESESDLAHKINAEAVGQLGRLAKENSKLVIHFSTDFVFDGTGDMPYTETDTPNPINAYGKTKLAGEALLIQSLCDHYIIRLEWTYGRAGNSFPKKIIELARAGKTLNVIDDQIGSPTATTEVAMMIVNLLQNRESVRQGVYHFAADGFVSRYDIVRFMFDTMNIDSDLGRCKSSDYITPAKRPLNSRFDCMKIKSALGIDIKPWQQPLKEFVEQL